MNLLYLKKFNNYYNRRLIRYSVLTDYLEKVEDYYLAENQDFNFNDGVSTTKICSFPAEQNWNPDYLVVFDNDNNIVSRWFVLEARRQSAGKYVMTLKRDVIADFYNEVRTAPVMVEKGKIDVENPLIYNKEQSIFNQIKTSETLLKDESGSAWIVGYILKDAIGSDPITITYAPNEGAFDIDTLNLSYNNPERPEEGAKAFVLNDIKLWGGAYDIIDSIARGQRAGFIFNYYDRSIKSYKANLPILFEEDKFHIGNIEKLIEHLAEGARNNIGSLLQALDVYFDTNNRKVLSQSEFDKIQELDGQIVYSSSRSKYYKLICSQIQKGSYNEDIDPDVPSDIALYQFMESISNNVNPDIATVATKPSDHYYNITYSDNRVSISLLPVDYVAEGTYNVTLSGGHEHSEDSIFDIFCLSLNENNLAIAQLISENLTNQNVLDLQILPYFPCRHLIGSDGIDISLGEENKDYFEITQVVGEQTVVVDYIYFARRSNGYFSIVLDETISVSNDPTEFKVQNECDMYRLVSPNYNGAFEFSATKNNGISVFNVSFTYKPHTPYIQVAPLFDGLYGQEFRDNRGLICNGDFSVSTLTSAWESYEINNKNFQNIFNTEIKSMDKMNRYNIIEQAITTPLNAASAGIGLGALTGNVGVGLAGGAASLGGGVADIFLGQSRYQTQRQLKKDLFNLNLQNIQARPDTLNKVSAYNVNNKYFPFLEYYTSTDVEKEALRNKIKYEGMTINAIGKIEEFEDSQEEYNYFKGSLIVMPNIDDDYHVMDAISVELEKGIYL